MVWTKRIYYDYTYWDALGDRVVVNLGLPVINKKIADSGVTPSGRKLSDKEKQLLYEKDKDYWIQTIMLVAFSGSKEVSTSPAPKVSTNPKAVKIPPPKIISGKLKTNNPQNYLIRH